MNIPNTYGHLPLAAEAAGAGHPVLTWAAVGVIVTAVGVCLVVLHRRRDTRSKRLTPGYDAATGALVVLDRLSAMTAIAGVTTELGELAGFISLLRVAEARSPEIPFGVIVATLDDYAASVFTANYATRLAADPSLLDSYLALARVQGVKLESARTAITTVQRRIEKLTGK
ncbi:hypothetical protein ACIQB5_29735 [Streptomyces sp. NPDC088560]|uniref:hypothetical protein n=1 Tax=Streptomyces sp. NPDC088560 TaxID=3365868 RepID=UPI00380425FD